MIDVINTAMSPADEKALLQQGIAAARAGDKASARARFRELTARNFDNELAWLWLASVADTPAHAVACLRRVLQINPSHEKARAALFRVLMEGGIQTARGGDKASAYASFSEASTLDATSELVWTWMASTAPSPSKALDALRRVLDINPSHEQAGRAYRKLVVQRGIDLAQAGDPAARAVLLEASAVDPMNETIWLWLARAVPPEESIEYYERILDINPNHDVARAALLQLRPPPAALPADEPAIAADPVEDLADEPPPVLLGAEAIALDATDIPEITVVDAAAEAGEPGGRGESEAVAAMAAAAPATAASMGDPAGDALIVEQFAQVESSATTPASTVTQAATQEEFVVYHGADISTVWAGRGATEDDASASANQAQAGHDAGTIDSGVGATFGARNGARNGATIDSAIDAAIDTMRQVDESSSSGAGSYGARASADAPASDVDSYLTASESTYASSELVVAASHAHHGVGADDLRATHEARAESAREAEAMTSLAAEASSLAATDDTAVDAGAETAVSADSTDSTVSTGSTDGTGSVGSAWTGAAPPAPANAPIAWNCPICLSGAPESAIRCPTCGSVVTLVDPDLLLDTDSVDRRHVLQVVARLKNRKVSTGRGKAQFDHYFTLGLAYVNGGRVTEGIAHLRMANDAQKNDPELKAQIDALERRVAQRAKGLQGGASKAPAHVNGKATKTPEPPPVELPVAPPPDAPAESNGTATYHATNGHGPRRTILVVDDSPTIQKVVSVTLEAHGHEVVTASDGMEALSKLRTLKPDLVLLDITMPHMDGYQLCRILRSNELTRQVPIVMLSGKDGLFDKMRGRMAGAASYITKPFAPSALPPLIEKYCKRVS